MSPRPLTSCLALGLALALAGCAAPSMAPGPNFADLTQAFAAADACPKDGRLSPSEATRQVALVQGAAAPVGLQGAQVQGADRDGDGFLNEAEFLALAQGLGASAWAASGSACAP